MHPTNDTSSSLDVAKFNVDIVRETLDVLYDVKSPLKDVAIEKNPSKISNLGCIDMTCEVSQRERSSLTVTLFVKSLPNNDVMLVTSVEYLDPINTFQ